jgi:hypothetical protein
MVTVTATSCHLRDPALLLLPPSSQIKRIRCAVVSLDRSCLQIQVSSWSSSSFVHAGCFPELNSSPFLQDWVVNPTATDLVASAIDYRFACPSPNLIWTAWVFLSSTMPRSLCRILTLFHLRFLCTRIKIWILGFVLTQSITPLDNVAAGLNDSSYIFLFAGKHLIPWAIDGSMTAFDAF